MRRLSNALYRRLLDFFYPPYCFHCEESLEKGGHLFCRGCSASFELIDPKTRCPYCFSEQDFPTIHPCQACREGKRGGIKMAAALSYHGPVASLVKGCKYGKLPYLAELGAAFMVVQFERLGWPLPDLVVPAPSRMGIWRVNHARLLAQSFAARLGLPCCALLKRRGGDLSQARLNTKQRERLNPSHFSLKRSQNLEGKSILLIDDVLTTGTTLRSCAQPLWDAYPRNIRALALSTG